MFRAFFSSWKGVHLTIQICLLSLLLAALLTACDDNSTPDDSVLSTATSIVTPEFTRTPEPTPTPLEQTSIPTKTPGPTATPTSTLEPTRTPTKPTSTSVPESVSPNNTIAAEDVQALLASLGYDAFETRVLLKAFTATELNCLLGGLESLDIVPSGDTQIDATAALPKISEVWSSCFAPERDFDILVAIIESSIGELSAETETCIRDIVIKNQTSDTVPRLSALFNSSFSSATCMNKEESLETEVAFFAREVGGLTEDERDCLRQVAATGEGLYNAFEYHNLIWPNHSAFDCLSEEQLLEFQVAHFAEGKEGMTNDQLNCVRRLIAESASVGKRLDTDEARYAVGGMSRMAATFVCLTNDQIKAVDQDVPDASIECQRRLWAERLPDLYEVIVLERFSEDLRDLAPQEAKTVYAFEDNLYECINLTPEVNANGSGSATVQAVYLRTGAQTLILTLSDGSRLETDLDDLVADRELPTAPVTVTSSSFKGIENNLTLTLSDNSILEADLSPIAAIGEVSAIDEHIHAVAGVLETLALVVETLSYDRIERTLTVNFWGGSAVAFFLATE